MRPQIGIVAVVALAGSAAAQLDFDVDVSGGAAVTSRLDRFGRDAVIRSALAETPVAFSSYETTVRGGSSSAVIASIGGLASNRSFVESNLSPFPSPATNDATYQYGVKAMLDSADPAVYQSAATTAIVDFFFFIDGPAIVDLSFRYSGTQTGDGSAMSGSFRVGDERFDFVGAGGVAQDWSIVVDRPEAIRFSGYLDAFVTPDAAGGLSLAEGTVTLDIALRAVPSPGAVTLLAGAGLFAARRRR